MSISRLKQIFDDFNQKKILIIGDVMLDAYVWGKISRISPEAPVPILSSVSYDYRLGGAANVAKNIRSLGAIPILGSVIGKDERGKKLLQLLEKKGYKSTAVVLSSKRKTTTKTRFISQGQHIIRIDDEDIHPLSVDIYEKLIGKIRPILRNEKIDAIIFPDYDKGVINKELIVEIVKITAKKNIPVLADPKKRNFNNFSNIQLFKPNLKEFMNGVNLECISENYEQLFEVAQQFQQQHSIDCLMITLSEKGIFISDSKNYYHIPAEVREIADVSGAGDTVISVAAVCLAAGLTPFDIAAISNLAGGIVCEHSVVVPIDKRMLFKECSKIVSSLNLYQK